MGLDVMLKYEVEEGKYLTAYDASVTHNLNTMAEEIGMYGYVWRPDELGVIKAKELIEHLQKGINALITNREHCKKFEPENGFGTYDDFLKFLIDYLEACQEYPNALVEADR